MSAKIIIIVAMIGLIIGLLSLSGFTGRLALFLVIYGGVGLLFVYLLSRERLYYARLSSLPPRPRPSRRRSRRRRGTLDTRCRDG